MTADKPSPFVPKLRFPEFRDGPDWSTSRGDALFSSINNRKAVPGLPVLAITQKHGAIPRDEIDYHVSVTAKSVANYKEVCEGDFIISLRSFQGGIEYSQFHGICSPAYVILRRKGDGSDHFFRHLFKSDRFIQQLTRNIEGLRDGKMISYAQFSEQLLPVPEPPEQQKIADCLGSLDDLIAAAGRKLEALRQHKQGLMQQLFPQAGETQPRLRFPEFEGAGDWEQKRLSSLVKLVSGVHLAPDMYSTTGEVPYFTGPSDFTDAIQCVAKWTAESVNIAKQQDTLITVKGSGVGKIWYLTLPSIAMGRQLMAVRTEVGDRRFIYQFLSTKRAQFKALASGNLIPGLSRGDILGMAAYFPSRNEQQKIADCLGSLDDLIAAAGGRVGALRQHKQGLMQQLFPSLEAESR